ncbi:MAG TPA: hypothetical protein VJ975_03440 [Candidatus Limnocylindria bacterium]|nr:hypothetical protein [Candidatus Limnocylindria bacterium]
MPPGAYAIVGLFAVVSLISGAIAASALRPRRAWGFAIPALATFGSLYMVGHRLAISIGPEVSLFGFRISLLFDAAVALAVAFAVAFAQAGVMRLFQPKERSAGRDSLA